GETDRLPLEVALMQMVSMPPLCENVVELLEWFEMSSCFILVLERPSPCVDLREFCTHMNSQLCEPLACEIMWQVVQAARHCCDCGVLHHDIKAENLLINIDTLQGKLIDFGCGDLLKDSPYQRFVRTQTFLPPESTRDRQYMGRPATIWSLGMLLYYLVCSDFPFKSEVETSEKDILPPPYLSRGCRDLISWCLNKDPHYRATLEDIISHERFMEELQYNVQVSYFLPTLLTSFYFLFI
ncbi:serine/threonine-protein kinase pim-1-like, partial [Neoarius graeffei]|uniref:serine/threonine-protein kinase pim-1-like n=1 Tax=Neoarius graeffei TaxID=443677 RepID=UPI00298CE9A6